MTGFVAAAIAFFLGRIFYPFHDGVWIPFFFGVLLGQPWPWVISAVLASILIWRADQWGWHSHCAGTLAGIWLAILVLYGVWYYQTLLVVVWAVFLSWQTGWRLWSYPRLWAAMALVPLVVILGAALTWRNLPWDNRFTLGLPAVWNGAATGLLLAVAVATAIAIPIFLAGLGIFLKPARPRLLELVRLEPRLAKYFDATLKVTRNKIPLKGQKVGRLEPVVSIQGKVGSWDIGFKAAGLPLVGWLSGQLRTPLKTPGLPGLAMRRILMEEVEREYVAWVAALDIDGEPHFARYVCLREAQIEAEIYFGLAVPALPAEPVKKLLESARAPVVPAGAGKRYSHLPWEKVAQEYQALWLENFERLVLGRGPSFHSPCLRTTDIQDANSIRARLRSDQTHWVVQTLKRLKIWAQGNSGNPVPEWLEPADPETDPHLPYLVYALNQAVQKSTGDRTQAAPAAALNLFEAAPKEEAQIKSGRRGTVDSNWSLLLEDFSGAITAGKDPVDWGQLSANWLAARLARSGSATIHQTAADLALALFLDSKEPAKTLDQAVGWLISYLGIHDEHGMLGRKAPPTTLAVEPADKEAAGLTSVLTAAWLARQGQWFRTKSILAVGVVEPKTSTPEIWRVFTHLSALILEVGMSAGIAGFGNRQADAMNVVEYLDILQKKPVVEKNPGLLFDGSLPVWVLAAQYSTRLEELSGG